MSSFFTRFQELLLSTEIYPLSSLLKLGVSFLFWVLLLALYLLLKVQVRPRKTFDDLFDIIKQEEEITKIHFEVI